MVLGEVCHDRHTLFRAFLSGSYTQHLVAFANRLLASNVDPYQYFQYATPLYTGSGDRVDLGNGIIEGQHLHECTKDTGPQYSRSIRMELDGDKYAQYCPILAYLG
jgi:hypothetical protein